MPVKSVAIIGAGVAGLTAALSFARYGVRCDIIEQAESLEEVGAGLQVSPNAARASFLRWTCCPRSKPSGSSRKRSICNPDVR